KPALEILHMPTEEEAKSAIGNETESMAMALNHLFQPNAPKVEDKPHMEGPSQGDAHRLELHSDPSHQTPTGPIQLGPIGPPAPSEWRLSHGMDAIPGTPGSPFPAPVPLKPVDKRHKDEGLTEGSDCEFKNPYSPPSDLGGFQFPGWDW
ncbi:MAG: hypothetical protein KDB61_08360, partial [Planctomycetes bacterium]|nr:hypothetical protein [Planctomycetota bacterium]